MKDYVTQAYFVEYDEAGHITNGGHQGISFTTDAIAAGARMLLANITFRPEEIWRTHYVDVQSKELCEKTDCPVVLTGLVLDRLPTPCRVEISALPASPSNMPALYDWSDPALTLSFEHPGRYAVRVLSAPYLPGVFEVSADG